MNMFSFALARSGRRGHILNMFKTTSDEAFRARIAARITFGTTLLAGACWMVTSAFAHGFGAPRGNTSVAIIGWTWLAAITVATMTRYVAARGCVRSGRMLSSFQASFSMPAVGVALMLPLSIQLLYLLLTRGNLDRFDDGDLARFDNWVALSIWLAGAAHVVFAVLSASRAWVLARGGRAISPALIYLASVAAGSFPFPVYPSIYIAITGIPIVPLLYAMKPYIAWERTQLERSTALPIAIARSA
jgi:hypothetical protein